MRSALTVTGNIIASIKVSLHKSAQVDGDIETPSIIIEDGAIFNGRLSMGKAGAKAGANLTSVSGGGNSKQNPSNGNGNNGNNKHNK